MIGVVAQAIVGIVLVVAGVIGVVVALSILRGFVLAKLWLWFVVPTFGLAPLTIPVAIGLGIIMSYMTYQLDSRETTEQDVKVTFGIGIIMPFFILFFGYIVKSFM